MKIFYGVPQGTFYLDEVPLLRVSCFDTAASLTNQVAIMSRLVMLVLDDNAVVLASLGNIRVETSSSWASTAYINSPV